MPRRDRPSRTSRPATESPSREVIHTWTRESSRTPAAGGRRAQYEILLYADGSLSCDCPGWTQRAVRSCKHTKEVAAEAQQIFAEHRSNRRPRQTARRESPEQNTSLRGRTRVAAPEPEAQVDGAFKRTIDF